jgi:hypothetical protein
MYTSKYWVRMGTREYDSSRKNGMPCEPVPEILKEMMYL